MAERYDALHVREDKGKSYFTKIGAMFPNRSGDGFTLVLDAVGAPVDGQYRILLKTPQPRDNKPSQGGSNARGGSGYTPDDLDDDVPF